MMTWINWTKVKPLPLCFSQNATVALELLTHNYGLRGHSKRDKEIDYQKDLEV